MQKLYRISGTGQTYSFLEYVCPKLDKKINIEIPDDFIDNELIDIDEDLDTLFEMGLIDELLYETILDGNTEDTVYFVADEVGDNEFICNRLLCKDGRLIGRMQILFDKYKHKIRWPICFIIFLIFLYFLFGKFF